MIFTCAKILCFFWSPPAPGHVKTIFSSQAVEKQIVGRIWPSGPYSLLAPGLEQRFWGRLSVLKLSLGYFTNQLGNLGDVTEPRWACVFPFNGVASSVFQGVGMWEHLPASVTDRRQERPKCEPRALQQAGWRSVRAGYEAGEVRRPFREGGSLG